MFGVRLQKVPMPNVRILSHVKTDGLANRIVCLTREAFILVLFRTKQKQVERQGFVKRVKVADEPVVVMKSEPKKPWQQGGGQNSDDLVQKGAI